MYTEEPQLQNLNFQHILNQVSSKMQPNSNHILIAHVSKREIKRALNKMEHNKAPSPDSFTVGFLKAC